MQIQDQKQKTPEQPQNVDRSRNYEKELADVIYNSKIFIFICQKALFFIFL